MTVCGIKHADGVCVMGECPHFKMCCPVVWNKSGEPMTNDEWRRTCSTEEFADFLADACAWAIEEQRCYKHTEKSTAIFWKQWLKEKYQPCNTL